MTQKKMTNENKKPDAPPVVDAEKNESRLASSVNQR